VETPPTGSAGVTAPPKRIQLRRTKGWRLPEGAVKVDRSTDFGNPWRVERWPDGPGWFVRGPGDRRTDRFDTEDEATAESVVLFRRLLDSGTYNAQRRVVKIREVLRGKDLACWCAEGAPCHADVLLEVANS
jgi:hypothetical protein